MMANGSNPLGWEGIDVVQHINKLFPTEQSLSNIDDVMVSVEGQIRSLEEDIRGVIHAQTSAGSDGCTALYEAQRAIAHLMSRIHDVKFKADKSELAVREITRDIKELDAAKKNITAAITTLNHLHMLVGGVETLKTMTQRRLYGEASNLMQGILNVQDHFAQYVGIPQVKQLSEQVTQIQSQLGDQIIRDVKAALTPSNSKPANPPLSSEDVKLACSLLGNLPSKYRDHLIAWLVQAQLAEYRHLFSETEDVAWIDKIDKRFAWIKKKLLQFEESIGKTVPDEWNLSERIAVEFCFITGEELSKLVAKRAHELDVQVLIFALQKTIAFEELLSRRFLGTTIAFSSRNRQSSTSSFSNIPQNPFEEVNPFDENVTQEPTEFKGLISRCFQPFLHVLVTSQDKKLSELLEQFVKDAVSIPTYSPGTRGGNGECASLLPSCADLFVAYKNILTQCAQLTHGSTLVSLSKLFEKYLREYATRVLQAKLPRVATMSSGISRELITANIIQNFQYLLKEGDSGSLKLTSEEIGNVCCVLTTAEYCMETTSQLELKIKEKVDTNLTGEISLQGEQDMFGKYGVFSVVGHCIQLLVSDLELTCDAPLQSMTRVQWSAIECVGDQSPYVTTLATNWKQTVPLVRDLLSSTRKYFTQYCVRFANSFIPKLVSSLFKCKPLGVLGAEQLLLDVHMMKSLLLDLPSLESLVRRKPPASYTKVVSKGMTRIELMLKLCIDQSETPERFIDQYIKLLPDSDLPELQRLLELKGVRRADQQVMTETYLSRIPTVAAAPAALSSPTVSSVKRDQESSRIRKLEKLIRKRL
nr:EOG090X024P [Lepidurus arcticus]